MELILQDKRYHGMNWTNGTVRALKDWYYVTGTTSTSAYGCNVFTSIQNIRNRDFPSIISLVSKQGRFAVPEDCHPASNFTTEKET